MYTRSDVLRAGTGWWVWVLLLCLIGPACARDRAAVVQDAPLPAGPEPVELVHPGPVHVPDLFSLIRQEASNRLHQSGLTPEVREELRYNFKLNGMHCRVLAQNPLPGARVAPGTRVTITVYVPVGTCE